jgi:hypothetical protein
MDRNEAIELLKNMHWSITTKMNREVPSSLALLMAIKALAKDTNVPTKEIIHCKDCKYWKEKPSYTYCERMYHMGFVEFLDYMVEENDFCSWAAKRGEADGCGYGCD